MIRTPRPARSSLPSSPIRANGERSKVWKILAALVVLPILVRWFKVVHQNDELLALSEAKW